MVNVILVILFGLIFGSFLNVCIFRLPREKSLIRPASHCPRCERPIRFYDNLPLVSFLILKGRCRQCGARISVRYPIVELITAGFFFLLYHKFGFSMQAYAMALFVCILIVISFIDLDFQIIPDILSLGGLCAGFVLSFFRPHFTWTEALWGIGIGGGILFVIAYGYQLITKKEGMGGGDIKLLGMIGAFCGVKGVIFSLLGASFIGTLVGIPLMLAKGSGLKYAIPFGPFLSGAAILYIFFGDYVIYVLLKALLQQG